MVMRAACSEAMHLEAAHPGKRASYPTSDIRPPGPSKTRFMDTGLSLRVRTRGALHFSAEVELCRHLAKLRKRTSIHFPHRLAAVDLHCGLGNTDIVGNLLAKAPPRDANHNFALPGT